MESFDVQVERWVSKAKSSADAAFNAIANDALARVKELTPVRTGNLRANWQIVPAGQEMSIGSWAVNTAAPIAGGVAGQRAASAGASSIASTLGRAASAAGPLGNLAGTLAGTAAGAAATGQSPDYLRASVSVAAEYAGAAAGSAFGPAGTFVGGALASTVAGVAYDAVMGDSPAPSDQLGFKIGQVLYITNPVAYARRVEFGFVGVDSRGRHYDQQGRGMMQQTIAELPQIAANAVRRINAGA